MVTLLKRRLPETAALAEPIPDFTAAPAAANRIVVLVPEGRSFRMFAFPEIEAAQAFVHDHTAVLDKDRMGVFQIDHLRPTAKAAEVVVMFRDTDRSELIQLWSFVDMVAARSFVQASIARGLDPGLVLLYWVTPVSLGRAAALSVADTTKETGRQPAQAGTSAATALATGPVAEALTPSLLSRTLASARAWPGWDGFARRMVDAAILNQEIYEDLRRDPYATGRAAIIVGMGALASGIGAMAGGPAAVLWHVAAWPLGLAALVYVVRWIAVRLFQGLRVQPVRLFQAAGLAASPGLLLVFGIVPVFGPLLVLAIFLWMLVGMSVAIVPVLEIDRESALLTTAFSVCLFFSIAEVAPALLA